MVQILLMKTTSHGIRPPMEDDVPWKMTSHGRRPRNIKSGISQQPLIGSQIYRKREIYRFRFEMKISSKLNPSDACDVLLSYVKRSNLNFQISESPFSVNVEIKKSFITNKNGVERSASFDDNSDTLKHENQLLIALNCALKISLAQKDEEKSAFREKNQGIGDCSLLCCNQHLSLPL